MQSYFDYVFIAKIKPQDMYQAQFKPKNLSILSSNAAQTREKVL